MMKVAYETLESCGEPQLSADKNRSRGLRLAVLIDGRGVGLELADEAINKGRSPPQISADQIRSVLATIKASTHHAIIMKRVHDRIVDEQETKPNPEVVDNAAANGYNAIRTE